MKSPVGARDLRPISLETAATRRRRRSKFPNPDRGHKSVILSVTENVWPPCPAPTLQDRRTNERTDRHHHYCFNIYDLFMMPNQKTSKIILIFSQFFLVYEITINVRKMD